MFSVPAHMFLWNMNDLYSHHKRRYNKREIIRKTEKLSLEILRITYWNITMFIPVLIFSNFFSKLTKIKPKNNLTLIPDRFNQILCRILKMENKFLLKHDIITGVSLICICKKSVTHE